MDTGSDRRLQALIALLPAPELRELASQLLGVLEALEQTDFGELEPVGVSGPTTLR